MSTVGYPEEFKIEAVKQIFERGAMLRMECDPVDHAFFHGGLDNTLGQESAVGEAKGVNGTLPVFSHGLPAYGSYQKNEISRKVSEIIFALGLIGFPIGTFLSIYLFLPATQWKDPEAQA
ncbi:hypothetical protein [Paludibacterium purpuratum]|uniref:Uncharacterized protein n=1 Tax=Paludibacterium purpuratum TaxID=1144873 RepID=A0A4V3DUV7_9NEIS|nr:hypothetical protein [Paludibacterium purpuratum]TDR77867.1 hypothetical protein DFP86_109107 [Paludibacterium purpuratum]